MIKKRAFLVSGLTAFLIGAPAMAQIQSSGRPAYRSPIDVAYSPDGSLLAVADRTLPGLSLIKTSDGSAVTDTTAASA